MNEAEWQTRKQRIDTRLRAIQPPWKIARYREGLELSALDSHDVEELPTANRALRSAPAPERLAPRRDGGTQAHARSERLRAGKTSTRPSRKKASVNGFAIF